MMLRLKFSSNAIRHYARKVKHPSLLSPEPLTHADEKAAHSIDTVFQNLTGGSPRGNNGQQSAALRMTPGTTMDSINREFDRIIRETPAKDLESIHQNIQISPPPLSSDEASALSSRSSSLPLSRPINNTITLSQLSILLDPNPAQTALGKSLDLPDAALLMQSIQSDSTSSPQTTPGSTFEPRFSKESQSNEESMGNGHEQGGSTIVLAKPPNSLSYLAEQVHSPVLKQNLRAFGITELAPIQSLCMSKVKFSNDDFVIVSPTGTGKTLAYLIPLVERALHFRESFSIILVPTKLLGLQLISQLHWLTKDTPLQTQGFFGGNESTNGAAAQFRRTRPAFLVSTPTQLLGLLLMQDKTFLKNLDTIVLDELDQSIDREIANNTKIRALYAAKKAKCLHLCPAHICMDILRTNFSNIAILGQSKYNPLTFSDRESIYRSEIARQEKTFRTLAVTATYNKHFRSLIRHRQWLVSDTAIRVQDANKIFPTKILHYYINVRHQSKMEALAEFLANDALATTGILICVRAGTSISRFADQLEESLRVMQSHRKCVPLYKLSMSYAPEQRKEAYRQLYSGELCLVVDDATIRGIDIPNLSHVLIYDFPAEPTPYIHIAGRTGRYNQYGKCLSIVSEQDLITLREWSEGFGFDLFQHR